ncbi:hypothetical protein [Plantactinospora sp. B24E8]
MSSAVQPGPGSPSPRTPAPHSRPAVQAAMAETLRPYLRAALATWD